MLIYKLCISAVNILTDITLPLTMCYIKFQFLVIYWDLNVDAEAKGKCFVKAAIQCMISY